MCIVCSDKKVGSGGEKETIFKQKGSTMNKENKQM